MIIQSLFFLFPSCLYQLNVCLRIDFTLVFMAISYVQWYIPGWIEKKATHLNGISSNQNDNIYILQRIHIMFFAIISTLVFVLISFITVFCHRFEQWCPTYWLNFLYKLCDSQNWSWKFPIIKRYRKTKEASWTRPIVYLYKYYYSWEINKR